MCFVSYLFCFLGVGFFLGGGLRFFLVVCSSLSSVLHNAY